MDPREHTANVDEDPNGTHTFLFTSHGFLTQQSAGSFHSRPSLQPPSWDMFVRHLIRARCLLKHGPPSHAPA